MKYKTSKMSSVKKIMIWSENTAEQEGNSSSSNSNGFFGIKVGSWCNSATAPPLVSMALDLVSTLQSTQGRTKV